MRTMVRLPSLVALCCAVLATPAAMAGEHTVGATGVLTGSAKSYTLTIRNTGSDPIKYFRLFVPQGVFVAKPGTGPAGWQLGTNGQVLFGQSAAGIPSAGSGAFTFPTDRVYPAAGGGRLLVSADGQADIPAALTEPRAKPAPCKCKKLTAHIALETKGDRVLFGPEVRATANRFAMSFFVQSEMRCTAGSEATCSGSLRLSPTAADRARGLRLVAARPPRSSTFVCMGLCGGSAYKNSKKYSLIGGSSFGTEALGRTVKTLSLEVDRICSGKVTSQVIDFAFDSRGRLDLAKSDLDGNGAADGKRKS